MPKSTVLKPRVKKSLPLIRCECGVEILLMPDLNGMSDAVEMHVEEHIRKEKAPMKAKVTAERIRNDLIVQVLKKASTTKK